MISSYILSSEKECCRSLEINGNIILVYKNPNSSDVPGIIESIGTTQKFRYLADAAHMKIFIWNNDLISYEDVMKNLGYVLFQNKPYLIWGLGEISNEKLFIINWGYDKDNFSSENIKFMKQLFFNDWDWLNEYVANWDLFLTDRQSEYSI